MNALIITSTLLICLNLLAQGNFNVEWDSPVWGASNITITQFERNNSIPEIVVSDGQNLRVFDGATKVQKYLYSNPDTSYFYNFQSEQSRKLDVNNDGVYDFALYDNDYEVSYSITVKLINGSSGTIFFQNSYPNFYGYVDALDIDGDNYVELCIYLYGSGSGVTRKIIVLSTPALVIGMEPQGTKATEYQLGQNYPNPFNPTTTIDYSIGKTADVQILLYNELGELIKTLVEGKKPAGKHSMAFDGTDLASGVYFYRISVDNNLETRKMVLIK